MAATTNPKVLQRKLLSGDLEPEDRANLNLVRQVRKLRKDGATILECARMTGQTERRLQQWMKRGVYQVLDAYLASLDEGTNVEQVEQVVRKAKQDFAGFAPDTIDYYRSCFERNPVEEQAEKGLWKNDDKAMWAADKVSKGLGLTEPEHAVRPVININIAHIRAEQAMVSADDAEAEAAAKAIDVTPTQAP